MIKISHSDKYFEYPFVSYIDEYVPLRVRSTLEPEPVLRIRFLKNNSIFELLVDIVTFQLRGLTIVAFENVHVPIDTIPRYSVIGVPVFKLLRPAQGPEFSERIDFVQDFSIGFGFDFIEIKIEEDSGVISEIISDRVKCFVFDEKLCKIRILGISSDEINLCKSLRVS